MKKVEFSMTILNVAVEFIGVLWMQLCACLFPSRAILKLLAARFRTSEILSLTSPLAENNELDPSFAFLLKDMFGFVINLVTNTIFPWISSTAQMRLDVIHQLAIRSMRFSEIETYLSTANGQPCDPKQLEGTLARDNFLFVRVCFFVCVFFCFQNFVFEN
jgi:hypothetical protein